MNIDSQKETRTQALAIDFASAIRKSFVTIGLGKKHDEHAADHLAEDIAPLAHAADCSLEDFVSLANLRDTEGYYRIEPDALSAAFRNGHSGRELLELAAATDSLGAPVFSQIKKELFSDVRHDIKDILYLAQFETDGGRWYPETWQVSQLLEHGCTRNVFDALRAIKNTVREEVFDSPNVLRMFVAHSGTPELARDFLRVTIASGDRLFGDGKDLVECVCNKLTPNQLQSWANEKSSRGNSIFQRAEDLIAFLGQGGTPEEAHAYDALRTRNGSPWLNGFEIGILRESNILPDRAAEFRHAGIDGMTALMYVRLGMHDVDFANDGRPKALCLIAKNDPTHICSRVFSGAEGAVLYSNISLHYDSVFRAVNSVEELLAQLEQRSDLDLLLLCGHGSKTSIAFGQNLDAYDQPTSPKTTMLKVGDDRIRMLDKLPKNCRVFLDSCLNAEGGMGAGNLADFVAECAAGRTVIAAKTSFAVSQLDVRSVYPFSVVISNYGLTNDTCVYGRDAGSPLPTRVELSKIHNAWTKEDVRAAHSIPASERRKKLEKIFKQIRYATYPVFHSDDVLEYADKLLRLNGIQLVQRADPAIDHTMRPAQYVFGVALRQPWCAIRSAFHESIGLEDSTDRAMKSLKFSRVQTPIDGDVAVYVGRRDREYDGRFCTKHFGIYVDKAVVSKYEHTHVMRHAPNHVPSDYGDFILWYRGEHTPKVERLRSQLSYPRILI